MSDSRSHRQAFWQSRQRVSASRFSPSHTPTSLEFCNNLLGSTGIVLQTITQTDLQLGEYGQATTHAPIARRGSWTITSTGLQLGEYSLIIKAASAPSDIALLPSCHGQMSSELIRIEYIANVRRPRICPKGTNLWIGGDKVHQLFLLFAIEQDVSCVVAKGERSCPLLSTDSEATSIINTEVEIAVDVCKSRRKRGAYIQLRNENQKMCL